VKPILAGLVIFVISVVILLVFKALTGESGRASGHAVINLWGITFMFVGALYFVSGLVMRFVIH